MKETIRLRPYQTEAWDTLILLRDAGTKRALIHLATGLGKTALAATDALSYQRAHKGSKVLFVSHMNDISTQAADTFHLVDPKVKTSRFTIGTMPVTPVVFATFQSLHKSLDRFDPSHFDYIVWDEAHHIEATTFKEVREHFDPQFELGLTATPTRADGLDILEYFGEPVYVKELADGIAEGWLSAVDYHMVLDEAVKEAVKEGFALKHRDQIRQLFRTRVRNEVIAKEVLDRRHTIGLDIAKTIVFCHNVEMAEEMAKLLKGVAYHSGVGTDRRRQIMRDFRNGALQVICTVDMFNEGIDIPDARLVVFLRSTSSRTIFEQQLGRGLRRSPGKQVVTVLDFAANIERIDFVSALGRLVREARVHVHTARERRLGVSSGYGAAFSDEEPLTIGSNFVFEDSTIELLKKYKRLVQEAPANWLTTEQVAALVNRKATSIRTLVPRFNLKVERFKLPPLKVPVMMWSPEQVEFVRATLASEVEPVWDISKQLGISPKKVREVAKEMGLELKNQRLPSGRWGLGMDGEEKQRLIDYIKAAVPEGYVLGAEVGKRLGVSRSALRSRATFLGFTNIMKWSNQTYYSPEQVAALEKYVPRVQVTHGQVMALWNKHNHVKTVADKLDVSPTIIYKHLRKEGIQVSGNKIGGYRKEYEDKPEGWLTSHQVSDLLGVSSATILSYSNRANWTRQRFMVKQGPPAFAYSPEQVEEMRQRYTTYTERQSARARARKGYVSLRELSKETNIHTRHLHSVAQEAGIKPERNFFYYSEKTFWGFGVTAEEADRLREIIRTAVPDGWVPAARVLEGVNQTLLLRILTRLRLDCKVWADTVYVSPETLAAVQADQGVAVRV